jgi:hypothetical protein
MTRPILLSFAFILIISGCGSQQHNLFSGNDLIGWSAFPYDKTALWSVKNGIIFCQGLTTTYLRSDKEYENYHFHCEWRWPDSPGNCAVGLHTSGLDRFRPNSIEVQLTTPDAGDLYLVGPALSVSKMGLTIHTDEHNIIRIPKELGNSENPTSQWNSLDVFCTHDTIRVFINGFPQNKISNISRGRGSICLQSRGVPIEWKNLYLNPLK